LFWFFFPCKAHSISQQLLCGVSPLGLLAGNVLGNELLKDLFFFFKHAKQSYLKTILEASIEYLQTARTLKKEPTTLAFYSLASKSSREM